MPFVSRILICVSFILTSWGTTSFAASQTLAACRYRHCVAVVDAGSTGSRIHLYAYDLNAQHKPAHIDELYTKKIKPGLATIGMNPVAVDHYVTVLMSNFPQLEAPVYVFGTGGMRLLGTDDQQKIYARIKQWFGHHPHWVLKDARTISGTEEGVLGWLALNHQLNALANPTHPLAGLVEVGGASAQIAFAVTQTDGLNPNDLVALDVDGRHVTLFSHSFLGLGVNEVFAHSQDRAACFPIGYPLADGALAKGDAELCQTEMGESLKTVDSVVHQALADNPTQDWYTISAVSALVKQAPFSFSTNEFNAQELLQQADSQLCQQDYQSLISRYPNNEYLPRNCLVASYVYGLLVHGYGFSPEQPMHYFLDNESDWTLGVVLHLL